MSSMYGMAQNVGINATGAAPVTSAALDVDMVNKGVLIPRVSLTSSNVFAPITGAATTSLMVYNTATAGVVPNNVTPGFYYWDGANWVRFNSGPSTNWLVGTTPATVNPLTATGFIGSTTSNHVDFVTNGIVRGRISNLGEFFIGSTSTVIVGDLMNGVANVSFPWAVNGYTSFDGAGVFGLRDGVTGTWGAIHGELTATLPAGAMGAAGLVSSNMQVGVQGQKPAGGLGWGGLFLNDLGYTGGLFVASDERVKTDIKPIENALSRLMQLDGKTYRYAAPYAQYMGGDALTYGFTAQNLETMFPEMVMEKSFTPAQMRSQNLEFVDVKIKAVSTITLIPVLVEAIKEQQKMIEDLQKEVEELKKR